VDCEFLALDVLGYAFDLGDLYDAFDSALVLYVVDLCARNYEPPFLLHLEHIYLFYFV